MEKKKNTEAKEAKIQPSKLSYEQLEQIVKDLSMQRNQLGAQLQRAEQIIDSFNNLSMLLGIVAKGENFNSDFIVRCTERIEKLVTEVLDNYDTLDKQIEEANKKESEQ